MESTNSGGSPQGTRLEDALAECLESKGSANYKRNLERVVENWISWCHDRDVETLEDVSPRTMAHYASYLRRRVRAGHSDETEGGIAASTAWTYYNQVSAFLSWAKKWQYLPENPAEKAIAKDEMPPRPSSGDYDRQFWTPEQRAMIMRYVDQRAHDAIDEKGFDAIKEVRDRALVAVLAYTGVRGGEILADSTDDRRTGLQWQDVNLDEGTIQVLGKSQQIENSALPRQAAEPLVRLKQLLDPPAAIWPVFPSRHLPSLYARIEEAGYERPDSDPWSYLFEHQIEPPSLSVSGARSLLKRLSGEADVPLDGSSKDYLTLHGARRGVGEALYRDQGAAAAQRTLRHADPSTTSQMYSHIEASELADDASAVFDDEN